MSTAVIGTVCGILTAATWGAGDWLTPRSKTKLSFWQINFMVNFVGSLMFVGLALAGGEVIFPGHHLARLLLCSALIASGYAIFVRALTLGAVGIVVPLSSIYPLITLILALVISGQHFAGHAVLAVVIIVAGAMMLAYEKTVEGVPLRIQHRATILTLLAVMLWGVGFFLLNPLVTQLAWQTILCTLELPGLVMSLAFVAVVYRGSSADALKAALSNPTIWVASTLLGGGAGILYLGAGKVGNIVIPAAISSLSPLFAVGLEIAIDKKKLGMAKRIGAVLAVGGIVVLNL